MKKIIFVGLIIGGIASIIFADETQQTLPSGVAEKDPGFQFYQRGTWSNNNFYKSSNLEKYDSISWDCSGCGWKDGYIFLDDPGDWVEITWDWRSVNYFYSAPSVRLSLRVNGSGPFGTKFYVIVNDGSPVEQWCSSTWTDKIVDDINLASYLHPWQTTDKIKIRLKSSTLIINWMEVGDPSDNRGECQRGAVYTFETDPPGNPPYLWIDTYSRSTPIEFKWGEGDKHNIDARNQPPYNFYRWSDNGLQRHDITVGYQDRQFTAYFTQTVRCTVNTSPPGLKVIVDRSEGTAPQVRDWDYASTHSIGVNSPQSGYGYTRYVYKRWSDDGDQSHSVTPTENTTYTAYFDTQYKLFTDVSPSGSGVVTRDPNPSDSWYKSGTRVKLTATPNSGYRFSHWSGDASGSDNPIFIEMNASKSVTANFSLLPNPEILKLTPSANSIKLGDTLKIYVEARNNGGSSNDGGISISFPHFTNRKDTLYVDKVYSSDDLPGYKEHPQGSPIYHRNGREFGAYYLLAEWSDNDWANTEINFLYIKVCPQEIGPFVYQVRSAMGQGGEYVNTPSSGPKDQQGWEVIVCTLTVNPAGVEEVQTSPKKFSLSQNYPNPFYAHTTIEYAIPKETDVAIKIYSITGQAIRTIQLGSQKIGFYKVTWDGRDNRGQRVASGVYFYRMQAGDFVTTKKLTILR